MQGITLPKFARLSLAAWLFWPMVVLAVVVTAADVAAAIRNSPTASAWLRAHADDVAALALQVENRAGDTTAYNGSCCYGILQLNTANILASGMTVDQYRNGTLQQQIDAWSRIQSAALNDPVIARLQNMQTFDGQPVDGAFILACVQLGQGNCQRMLNSGSCAGFADANGTTICSMASTIRNGVPANGGGNGNGAGNGGGNGSGVGNGGQDWGGGVYAGGPTDIGGGFAAGAGFSMNYIAEAIKLVLAAVMFVLLSSIVSGIWARFSTGRMEVPTMANIALRGMVVLLIVIALVN